MNNGTKLHESDNIDFYSPDLETKLNLPLADGGISAGFPSPADDMLGLKIDLNLELIKNPSATFYGRVKGNSMQDVGITDGDLMIIDKSLEATDGKIAVCFIDGEFTVKRIKIEQDCCWLVAENDEYQPIKITDDNDFLVWGIVTHLIKSF